MPFWVGLQTAECFLFFWGEDGVNPRQVEPYPRLLNRPNGVKMSLAGDVNRVVGNHCGAVNWSMKLNRSEVLLLFGGGQNDYFAILRAKVDLPVGHQSGGPYPAAGFVHPVLLARLCVYTVNIAIVFRADY